ncbi:hypothetical protein [Corynebacterium renale]|uniref:Uncharacterized protein n=1 Tax=Corynebacterium renale TaxID=1724 RepID=A0A2A9DMD5_9CORY|nr:hypothetical protein [Corynebacterium renale]PFG27907.1 hypothetical protein ATK06_0988 [Corynebacterium renale]SQI21895.1 Uncharacterised protein [Corynebacterium renale]
METWRLDHPDYGAIEVTTGFDAEFRAIDPSWPGDEDRDAKPYLVEDSYLERLKKWAGNPQLRLQISVDGEVRRQFDNVPNGRVALSRHIDPNKLTSVSSASTLRTKPHLEIRSNIFGEVLGIDFRDATGLVEFTPPEDSRGAKRYAEMESSNFKRVAYPLMAGLGKSGWAIALLVLGPLVGRFLHWLFSFLPDFDLPDLPSLPDITLPVPTLPQIDLPVPHIPFPSLPHFDVPDWILFLAEYSKIWMPLAIAVVLAFLAVRNHKRSEQQKRQWQQRDRDGGYSEDAARGDQLR